MILCHDLFRRETGVCDIPFQAIPFSVFPDLLLADADIHIIVDLEELAVSPLVYLVLGDPARCECLPQTFNPFGAIYGVLCGTFGTVRHNQSVAVVQGTLMVLSVLMRQRHDPLRGVIIHVPYPSSYNEPVAAAPEHADVTFYHEPGVGHDNEVVQTEALLEVVNYGDHGVALVLGAIEYRI